MRLRKLWWRLALAPLALALALTPSRGEYLFADAPRLTVRKAQETVPTTSTRDERLNAVFSNDKYRRDVDLLSVAIRLDPKNYALYNARGNAFTALGDRKAADADFGIARRLQAGEDITQILPAQATNVANVVTQAAIPVIPLAKEVVAIDGPKQPAVSLPVDWLSSLTPSKTKSTLTSESPFTFATQQEPVATRSATKPVERTPVNVVDVEKPVPSPIRQPFNKPATAKRETMVVGTTLRAGEPKASLGTPSGAQNGTMIRTAPDSVTRRATPAPSMLAMLQPGQPQPGQPQPGTGGPMTGGPMTGGPMTGGPMTGGPMTGGPTTGGPMTGGPGTGTTPDTSVPTPRSLEQATAAAGQSVASSLAERINTGTQGGGSTTSVSQAQVQAQASQSSSTGELLERAAGVSVKRTSAINLDARVRGFNNLQTVGIANGIPQLKTRVDIDTLFSQIDPGIVRNIEVINGPYTSLQGPGMAFVIADLQGADKRYENGAEFHGNTSFNQASNGQGVYVRQSVWGGGSMWGFYASSGLRSGNDYAPGGNSVDFDIPASYQQWDGYFAASVDLTRCTTLDFSYLRSEKNDLELPGVIYDVTQSKDEQFNLRYVLKEETDGPENVLLQYYWRRNPYHGDSLHTAKHRTFYDAYITNVYNGFVDNPATPTVNESEFNLANTFGAGVLQSTGARALLTWGAKDTAKLTVGADWRRYVQFYQESHVDFTGSSDTVIFGSRAFGIPKSSFDDLGLLLHLNAPMFCDMVTLTAGGRLDTTRAFVNNDTINAGDLPSDPTIGASGDTGLDTPNETLGMAYATAKIRLSEKVSLDSGIGYAMRAPTLPELYSDNVFVPLVRIGNGVVSGNSTMTPERNTQYDLGLTGRWELVTGSVRGFYSNIDNYILYRELTNADGTPVLGGRGAAGPFTSFTYEYLNLQRATIYGGDIFAEVRLLSGLAVGATVLYQKGTNHSPSNGAGAEALPNIPPLSGNVSVRVNHPCDPNRWGIEMIARLANQQGYVADSLNELPTAGFGVFDVRAYAQLRKNVKLTGSIENLFDRTYTQHGSLAVVDRNGNFSFVKEPGFNARIGLEVEY